MSTGQTGNGDSAAQQARANRRARRDAAAAQFLHSGGRSVDKGSALKVKGVGEGLKGYPPDDDNAFADNGYVVADAAYRAQLDPDPDPESSDRTMSEPYLKVNTPNEYPQSSWGHIGRRPYGGAR